MRASRFLLLLGVALYAGLFTAVRSAAAHPMGNFSINHYSGLAVTPSAVHLLYVIDMAEIPTFQELSSLNVNRAEQLSRTQRAAYLSGQVRRLAEGLTLRLDGRPLRLRVEADDLLFPPGAGGLSTERIYLELSAALPKSTGRIAYSDGNFVGRAGWKEIVVRSSSGARLRRSSVPALSRSHALTIYPSTITSSPPQDTSAVLELARDHSSGPYSRASAAVLPPLAAIRAAEAPLLGRDGGWSTLALGLTRQGPSASAPHSAGGGAAWGLNRADVLTNLINHRQLPWSVLLVSLIVAFWFGAAHALSPGHGKTIVAAYLVGNRGTAAHAALLGMTVTVTHTAGVFALGLITLYLSRFVVPDQLYPWLGFVSGLLVAGMGVTLFVQRLGSLRAGTALEGAPSRMRKPPAKSDCCSAPPCPSPPLQECRTSLTRPVRAKEALPSVKRPPTARSMTAVGDGAGWQGSDGRRGDRATCVGGSGAGANHRCEDSRVLAHGRDMAVLLQPDRHSTSTHHHDHRHHDPHSSVAMMHRHGRFGLPHSHGPTDHETGERVGLKSLIALGVSGGLLPCPSALVVLLSAIAFHRVAFGMVLIVAFSLGLATTLMGIGMLVVYSRRVVAYLRPIQLTSSSSRLASSLVRALPAFSALVVAGLGSIIAIGALGPGLLPAI